MLEFDQTISQEDEEEEGDEYVEVVEGEDGNLFIPVQVGWDFASRPNLTR